MKVMMLLVCATLCSALVPPIDMCERCIHQFVDRQGCQAWRRSAETGHHMHHEDYMDDSCARFIDSIKDTPQDDECGERARMVCNIPFDHDHQSDGHGRDEFGNNVWHWHDDWEHNHDLPDPGHDTNEDPWHLHEVIGSDSYEHYHLCDLEIFDTPACSSDLGPDSPHGPSSRLCQCYDEVSHHDVDRSCMVWDPHGERDEMGNVVPIATFSEINYQVCLACMDDHGSFMLNHPDNDGMVEVSCNGAMKDDDNDADYASLYCLHEDYASHCPRFCGRCDASKYVFGCTDPMSGNYSPDATQDDGSCMYPEPSCPSSCRGFGSCVNGVCDCYSGYSGVDCGVEDAPEETGATGATGH